MGVVMFIKLSIKSSNTRIASLKDQKINFNRVERYHNEKTKAHIIRLELIGYCMIKKGAFKKGAFKKTKALKNGRNYENYCYKRNKRRT